jgi:hypothetical protein
MNSYTGNFTHPNALYREMVKGIEEFQRVRMEEKPTTNETHGQNHVRWRAPVMEWNKANWDVGIDRANERLGVGIVVRNSEALQEKSLLASTLESTLIQDY